jgi:hypothetical protein
MGEVIGLFISFGLLVGSGEATNPAQQSRYIDASRNAFDAGYIQSGIKPNVDKLLGDYERRYVPKELEKYGSVSAIVLKVIVQKQLQLTWSF